MIAKEIKADGANSPAFFWIRESAGKWLNSYGLTASNIKIRCIVNYITHRDQAVELL
jgi:hypothetical protein